MPAEKTRDTILKDLFKDDPTPEDVVVDESTEEVEEPEEIVEETEEEHSEDVVEETIEDEDDDYEAPIKKPEPKEEVEEDPVDESAARKRAKIEGKRRKELELTLKEKELEFDRVVKEREELAAKLAEIEHTTVRPREHPDYVAKLNEIVKDTQDFVEESDAPHADVITRALGDYTKAYREADAAENRADKMMQFKDKIAQDIFGDPETTFNSLTGDERKSVNDFFKYVRSAKTKVDKLLEIEDELEKKVKTGTLAVGVKEYERSVAEFKPILDVIGDLPEEVIEANPYAIESVVATVAKSPEGKKRLENAKRDVLEIVAGLRPLTQAEIEKFSANGGDIKAFQAQRQKAFAEKKKKLVSLFIQGLVTRSNFKEMSEELATLKKKKSKDDSEEDVLRSIRKKKPVVAREEPKKKTTASIVDGIWED